MYKEIKIKEFLVVTFWLNLFFKNDDNSSFALEFQIFPGLRIKTYGKTVKITLFWLFFEIEFYFSDEFK
jgi:hypothetical protein